MSFWSFANPARFMGWSARVMPWAGVLAALCLGIGLSWGFFLTPDDYRQGSTVKIIYVHVPSALMAINAWLMMLVASLIWLVRRHHVSALAARAAAPVGLTMTLIALVTGAVWGTPMWGTWWAWDPRLTSFLILFLFYLGYIALWEAVEDPDTAADLVRSTSNRMASPQREALAQLAQGATLVTALLVGADQIGIHITWVAVLAAIALASLLGGVMLAASLGARSYVANLIGARHLRDAYQVGDFVRVAGHEGRIVDISNTSLLLETSEGRLSLPGRVFNDEAVLLLTRPPGS
jgi:heme exporter protein C